MDDLEQLDVGDEHAPGRHAAARAEALLDPRAPLLADVHQRHGLLQPRHHDVDGGDHPLRRCDLVDQLSVGRRPERVADLHEVVVGRHLVAIAGDEHLRDQAVADVHGVGGRRGEVGRRRRPRGRSREDDGEKE